MQSSEPGHLFQSNQQLQDDAKRSRKRKAAERLGDPMTVGKVIDFVVHGPTLYSAESGWLARQVDIAVSRSIAATRAHRAVVEDYQALQRASGSSDLRRLDADTWPCPSLHWVMG